MNVYFEYCHPGKRGLQKIYNKEILNERYQKKKLWATKKKD